MTSLFKLINAASIVVVNGYEIDEFVEDVPGELRLGCGDEDEFYVTDQEVELDSDGEAIGVDKEGKALDFEFKIIKPLTLGDL